MTYNKFQKRILNSLLTEYEATSKALLLGGKVRICAPIPWVAHYFEIGIGTSLGSFKTYLPNINKQKKGLLMHIPFSLGLALGRSNNVEFELTYY
ncbi:hypothetical protein [Snuella sedimenti]|uniref:Uncharacterized protein n=1 Tax=Snuella sedimenti TaxID=2798802 RepID=A0A8J7IGT8_9FLAO|nr:hypothetical protein [Snuella sedimenti]MBJ6367968.1 hypothetical protein [Snuella sedimenti]